MVFKPAETDAVDPSLGALLGFVFGDALNGQAVGGVLRHGAVREQGEFLKHHRLLVPAEIAQVVRRHCQDIHAVDYDLPLGRFDQPVDMTDQGGLSRSGQAHDHLYPSLGNVDIDVTKTQDMAMLVQQLLLGGPVANMRHGGGGVFAENLVEVADLNLVSHGQPPGDAPAGDVHIPVKRGRR